MIILLRMCYKFCLCLHLPIQILVSRLNLFPVITELWFAIYMYIATRTIFSRGRTRQNFPILGKLLDRQRAETGGGNAIWTVLICTCRLRCITGNARASVFVRFGLFPRIYRRSWKLRMDQQLSSLRASALSSRLHDRCLRFRCDYTGAALETCVNHARRGNAFITSVSNVCLSLGVVSWDHHPDFIWWFVLISCTRSCTSCSPIVFPMTCEMWHSRISFQTIVLCFCFANHKYTLI